MEAGGFPNIEFDPESSVEGCIYVITPAQLKTLDMFMGSPEVSLLNYIITGHLGRGDVVCFGLDNTIFIFEHFVKNWQMKRNAAPYQK